MPEPTLRIIIQGKPTPKAVARILSAMEDLLKCIERDLTGKQVLEWEVTGSTRTEDKTEC